MVLIVLALSSLELCTLSSLIISISKFLLTEVDILAPTLLILFKISSSLKPVSNIFFHIVRDLCQYFYLLHRHFCVPY